GSAHGDAHRADRKQLDDTLEFHRPVRTDSLDRRQSDHLRLVEKVMTRMPPARIELEWDHLLSKQMLDWLTRQVVGHIVGIDIDHLSSVSADLRRFTLGVGFGVLDGHYHTGVERTPDHRRCPRWRGQKPRKSLETAPRRVRALSRCSQGEPEC